VTTAPKLDPVSLAVEACRRLWQARDHALLLGIPLLALGVAWQLIFIDDLEALLLAGKQLTLATPQEMVEWQFSVIGLMSTLFVPSILLHAILAGNLTRLLLIGPGAERPLLGLALDARLGLVIWRFVQMVLAGIGTIIVVSIPLSVLAELASMAGSIGMGVGFVAFLAAGLATLVVCLRLTVAAAATAVDRPMRLAEAWRATAGNATGLLGAILAINLPAVGGGFILSILLNAILPSMPMTTSLLLNLVTLVSSLLSLAVIAIATERLLQKPAPRS
jgi:hypothetical protein